MSKAVKGVWKKSCAMSCEERAFGQQVAIKTGPMEVEAVEACRSRRGVEEELLVLGISRGEGIKISFEEQFESHILPGTNSYRF
mmetsp:Transcript_18490/g.26237  ORF Transcript_18490/g.26237 Transcript_18490/m.26237 type:complete len:84 (+) Transcript_18490:1736-1987(+)